MRQQKDKTLELLLAVINVFNQQQKLLGVNLIKLIILIKLIKVCTIHTQTGTNYIINSKDDNLNILSFVKSFILVLM